MPTEALSAGLTPVEAAEKFLDQPDVALLESPPGFPRLGRRSFLSAAPVGHEPALARPPVGHTRLGHLSYEVGHRFERRPHPRYDDLALPLIHWPTYDWLIEWAHAAGTVLLHTASETRRRW